MSQTTTPTTGSTFSGGLWMKLTNGEYQQVVNATGALIGSQSVSANTNGTTAVSVFGTSGLPYAITITGVYLVSLDTTAGNVTVEAPASTVVATIAKGASAGALVGATSLANTSVPAGTNVVVDSSSAGNATVFIQYTVAA